MALKIFLKKVRFLSGQRKVKEKTLLQRAAVLLRVHVQVCTVSEVTCKKVLMVDAVAPQAAINTDHSILPQSCNIILNI